MKKKKLILLLLVVSLVASLFAGCSKKETASVSEESEGDKYIYVPTTRTITCGADEYISSVALVGEKLKYLITVYDKDYNTSALKIHTEDKDGSNPSDMEIENVFGKEEYVTGCAFVDSKIILTATSYSETGNKQFVAVYDENGKNISKEEIKDFASTQDDARYYSLYGNDAEGNLIYSDYNTLYQVSTEGNVTGSVNTENGYISGLFLDNDGTLYAVQYEGIKSIDFKTGNLTDKWAGPGDDIRVMFEVGNGRVLAFGYDAMMEFHKDTNEWEKIATYLAMDLDSGSTPYAAWSNDDGTISFVTDSMESDRYLPSVVTLTKKEKTPEMIQNEIHVAVSYANYSLTQAAKSFNRTNGVYRVVIDEYTDDKTYEFDTTAFNTALGAGKVDLVGNREIIDNLKPDEYQDLNQYLKNDGDIDLSEYYSNIFEGCEQKGALYAIPTSFSVYGYCANSDYVPKDSQFDFDAFLKLLKENKDKYILPDQLDVDFLTQCISFSGNKFIDYENAKCDFNNDDFIQLMEFAKTKPSSYEEMGMDDFDYYGSVMKGETILFSSSIQDVFEIQICKKVLGDKFNPVGLPVDSGSAFAYGPSELYAVPVNSAKKEAAWEFIKYILSDKIQGSDYMNGFPVKKKFFDLKMEKLMKEDSNGGGAISFGNGEMLEIDSPTKEDIQVMIDCVNKATICQNEDSGINDIIKEEFEAFKKGGKSASEVADIIQNRVTIYLAEKFS